MKRLYIVLLLLFQYGIYYGQTWQLVWEDNFDNQAAFNSRWDVMNNMVHSNTLLENDNYNLNTSSGYLEITSNVNNPAVYPNNDPFFGDPALEANSSQQYVTTSAWIETNAGNDVRYGKIEARILLQGHVQGYWPAFWTFIGHNVANASNSAEIDIFEMDPNLSSDKMTTNYHWSYDPNPTPNPNKGITHEANIFCSDPLYVDYSDPNNPTSCLPFWFDYENTWYTYSIEWEPTAIRWYINGYLFRVETNHQIVDPSRIILSAGIPSDKILPFPPTWSRVMIVDYVKFYKQVCGPDQVISTPYGSYVEGGNITYTAGAVSSGNRYAVAGNSITLEPNFDSNGYEFTAEIDPDLCVLQSGSRLANQGEDNGDNQSKNVPEDEFFSLYPNPNNGQFTLKLGDDVENALIEVYDMMGKRVFVQTNVISKLAIDVSDQPKGIYLVKVTIGDEVVNKKIVYQ